MVALTIAKKVLLGFGVSFFVATVATTPSSAQTSWTKHGDPVLTGGVDDQDVVKESGNYEMWYQVGVAIHYATSTNGVDWTEQGSVLEPGLAGEWDEFEVDGPAVIVDSGIYKMWYSTEAPLAKIGYAISPDGVSWAKLAANPVLDGEIPTVVKDGAIFRMWYVNTGGIFYATSPNGVDWTVENGAAPVIESNDIIGVAEVIRNGSIFQMWYELFQDGVDTIGYAYSTDGVTWSPREHVVLVPDLAWEMSELGDPSVVFTGAFANGEFDALYEMWYAGADDIGYATSTGIDLIKLLLSDNDLLWSDLPGLNLVGFDVVSGDLNTLGSTAGDFAMATMGCVENDWPDTTLSHGADPGMGAGIWYLVAPVLSNGTKTYDTLSSSQAEPRDFEIGVSGVDCP